MQLRGAPPASRRKLRRVGVSLLALCVLGCAEEQGSMQIAEPSFSAFEASAYPLLLRDCGMAACHGDPARMLHVVGPGRTRLDPSTSPIEAVTEEEVRHSYDRARSMIDPDQPAASRLLLKPLAQEAGGGAHGGTDSHNRDVYGSVNEAAYRALYAWVHGARTDGDAGGGP